MTCVRYAIQALPGANPGSRATFQRQPLRDALRRGLNIAVAAVGLATLAPLMVVIGLLIRLTSGGPIFYAQNRVGIDRRARAQASRNGRRHRDCGGKLFTIYKFRTMTVAAPGRCNPGEVWATPGDPRVTRLGRMLRRSRLDELPQLINVLRGDMNVVGPRPEQPTIFERLRARVERYPERQCVRPGITGWAQVNLPYDRTVEDVRRKLSLDLEYIRRQSVLEDLKIMARTPGAILGVHSNR
jgi:lipopolysaccharide/colanic/teichoic acid biosynthesis glycosyltransferase